MITLNLTPQLRERIAEMMTHACEHPMFAAELQAISPSTILVHPDEVLTAPSLAEPPSPARDLLPHRHQTPEGLVLYFCIEQQPQGWCRHLGVWTHDGTAPHEVACAMLRSLFGFRGLHVTWKEDDETFHFVELLRDDEDPRALHLLEPWRERPGQYQ